MDINLQFIHAFMDIHLDILGFLWISMHRLAMDSRSRDTTTKQALAKEQDEFDDGGLLVFRDIFLGLNLTTINRY